MAGQIRRIADSLWFIQGEKPEDVNAAPDWCNTVIYRTGNRFRGHADEPVVAKYLALELPRTPVGLQNVITTTLLQLGYRPHGRRRHQRCAPPADRGAE
jgi:hypothetical protein